jgi:predicted nucleic acid-binding protein
VGLGIAFGAIAECERACATVPLLKYLVDTNVISDWMRGGPPVAEWMEEHQVEVAISSLTVAELRRGIESKPESKSRRELEREFGHVMEFFEGAVWLFDEAAAFEWGRLMAEARNHPIPFDDSLIGAIARSMTARVVTRNVKHFPGCPTVDPWTGKESSAWRIAS